MKTIGVFGLNLSEKSGGAYRLIEGMMQHASCSSNKYLYITEKTSINNFPSNVELVLRNKALRILSQALPRFPFNNYVFKNEVISKYLVKALAGVNISNIDGWLWPHCFSVVPNLKNISVICHDMIHKHYPEYFDGAALSRRSKGESSLEHADAILCPSYNTQKDLLGYYPNLRLKTRVFPETACEILSENECADEIKNIKSKFDGVTLFIFVGVDWPHKNHKLLIDAAEILSGMTDNKFKVVFVGSRRSNSINSLLKDKQLHDKVIDVGPVSRRELAAYYYVSRALLFPSLCEGFGIPLVEAMHYKLPIVASNQSCMPEICGESAKLLSPDKPDLWAKHMFQLLNDETQYAKYSQLSHLRSNEFTWQKTWNALDLAFEELLY